ncbi:MAG: hypothetical protein ACRD3L_15455 [Terriglobales bacterium]
MLSRTCVIPPVWPEADVFSVNAPIVANPLNPKQLLLGSNDSTCTDTGPGFDLSNDGGLSWQHRCATPLFRNGNEFDPSGNPLVGIDRLGRMFEGGYFVIDDDFSSVGILGMQRSVDGGVDWSSPTPVMGRKNAITTYAGLIVDDSPSSPYVNSVYVSAQLLILSDPTYSQIVVSHTHDGGQTWQQVPVGVPQRFPFLELYTNLATARDGAVYVSWDLCRQGRTRACAFGTSAIMLSKSTDGGNTWSTPTLVTHVRQTWPLPNVPNIGVDDFPVIGIDNSDGPHAGNLYICGYSWNGSYMRVWVVRSSDGGQTWSKSVPVAPDDDTHDQFFPWLSVSPDGTVGVSWMDRRNDPANTLYQPFAAFSRDGGQTFGTNVLLNEGFSDPNRSGSGNGWIGDYTGNTWAGPDYFVAAWMDNSQTPALEDVVGGVRLK